MEKRIAISGSLPAGAMAYALFTAIISSMILSAIILGAYYTQVDYHDARSGNRSLVILSSAINLSLALENTPYHQEQRYPLFDSGSDSVTIDRQPWGLWDVLKVQSETALWQYKKYYLRGYQRSKKGESSLYLVDEGRPMSVSGKARISGVAYLPKAGIRSAYVGRVGYMNDKLFYGEKRVSSKKMPDLNKERIAVLDDFAKGNVQRLYPDELQAMEVDTSSFSFLQDQVLFRKSWEWIVNDSLSGRVWLHANKKIRVRANAKL
ncbi:MAG: hypothetical protein AAFO69_12900, partial [Bacteroidota bacterium]